MTDRSKETAAAESDVFLTWPDTVEGVAATVDDMAARAARYGRNLGAGCAAM